jgi:hypothetical protein
LTLISDACKRLFFRNKKLRQNSSFLRHYGTS